MRTRRSKTTAGVGGGHARRLGAFKKAIVGIVCGTLGIFLLEVFAVVAWS